jgi:hypothetical protein
MGDSDFQVGEVHFRSFNEGILRLDWRTKYACPTTAENPPEKDDPDTGSQDSKHWGFLTWLIIMYFPSPNLSRLFQVVPFEDVDG